MPKLIKYLLVKDYDKDDFPIYHDVEIWAENETLALCIAASTELEFIEIHEMISLN